MDLPPVTKNRPIGDGYGFQFAESTGRSARYQQALAIVAKLHSGYTVTKRRFVRVANRSLQGPTIAELAAKGPSIVADGDNFAVVR